MSRLRDPMRFAAFVEGASHLRDEEILHFESSKYSDEENNDSDISLNDSDEEEEINNRIQLNRGGSRLHHNGHPSVNTAADISEDEDNSEESNDNYYRGRPSPSRLRIVSPKSRQTTPTIRARPSSTSKLVIRTHRIYKEEELSDES